MCSSRWKPHFYNQKSPTEYITSLNLVDPLCNLQSVQNEANMSGRTQSVNPPQRPAQCMEPILIHLNLMDPSRMAKSGGLNLQPDSVFLFLNRHSKSHSQQDKSYCLLLFNTILYCKLSQIISSCLFAHASLYQSIFLSHFIME